MFNTKFSTNLLFNAVNPIILPERAEDQKTEIFVHDYLCVFKLDTVLHIVSAMFL